MNEFDLKKCRELVHSEKYNEALPHLESLLNSSTPSDKQTLSRIHYLTGICLHKLQIDYKIALEHYNKALKNGFDESWVRYNRGRLYIKLGDLDIAISDLRRAVELGHKDAKIELDDLSSYMESDSTSLFKLNSPVFVLSVPKSGTMLLQNILVSIFGEEQVIPSKLFNIGLIDEKYISALPELKNKIYIGHLHYSDLLAKKLHNIPKILLLRDPRDYIISYAHFLDKIKKDHFGSEEYLWDSLETIDNKISAVILGMTCKQVNHRLASAHYTYLNYCLKWIDPFSIIIRYEDIVGSKFGGDDSVVVKTFSHIMSRIGVKIDESELRFNIITGSDPNKSPTFRSGNIGSWQDELTETHRIQIKTAAPSLVSTLGFSADENWESESFNMNRIAPQIDKDAGNRLKDITNIQEKYHVLQTTTRNDPKLQYLVDGWGFIQFIESGDYENALPAISRLLKLIPDHPDLNYFYGYILHAINKDLVKAKAYYDKALENGFDEFWIMYNRGLLYRDLGELDTASNDLRRAIELDPNNPAAKSALELVNLSKAEQMVHGGLYNEALPHLESLLNSSTPSDKQTLSRIHYFTAVCLHKLQLDYTIALEHYNKALENGFDEFWIMYNRGLLYRDLGELDTASNDLRRAIELDPNNPAAKSALELVNLSNYNEE